MQCKFGNCTTKRVEINRRTKQPYIYCTRHRIYQNNYKKKRRTLQKNDSNKLYNLRQSITMPPPSMEIKLKELKKELCNYHKLFGEVEKIKYRFNTLTETQVKTEKYVRDQLCSLVNGTSEYVLPSGDRIDVITENAIYEVKRPQQYKSGIGQLLVYSQFCPDRKKILYLTKLASPEKMQYILHNCQIHDIYVELFAE